MFRRLVAHLRTRTDVQNIDLMNLAGFCRNCLANWYRDAAAEAGVEMSKDGARELVYGMPYAEWQARYQKEASGADLAGLREEPAQGVRGGSGAPEDDGEPFPLFDADHPRRRHEQAAVAEGTAGAPLPVVEIDDHDQVVVLVEDRRRRDAPAEDVDRLVGVDEDGGAGLGPPVADGDAVDEIVQPLREVGVAAELEGHEVGGHGNPAGRGMAIDHSRGTLPAPVAGLTRHGNSANHSRPYHR